MERKTISLVINFFLCSFFIEYTSNFTSFNVFKVNLLFLHIGCQVFVIKFSLVFSLLGCKLFPITLYGGFWVAKRTKVVKSQVTYKDSRSFEEFCFEFMFHFIAFYFRKFLWKFKRLLLLWLNRVKPRLRKIAWKTVGSNFKISLVVYLPNLYFLQYFIKFNACKLL